MKKMEFTFEGKKVFGYCEKVGKNLWVHVNGKSFVFENERSRRKSSGGTLENENEISAPMPGKITDIKLSLGAGVNKGDVVVIMEAMKMEYSLKSTKTGKILAIKVRVGEQVTLGQVLVEIGSES